MSIQSWVAYGHAGNASAVFPLQRLGAEVWAINTVQFSNHTGYGAWTGDAFSGEQVRALVEGVAARGVLGRCDAVLSGYLGNPGIGDAVLDAIARVRAVNPAAFYCCDPVIGDDGRVYVRPGVADLLRDRALAEADIATPNQFELGYLTGMDTGTLAGARAAIADVRARMRAGPRCVLLTSLRTEQTPHDAIDLLAAEGDELHLLRTPLLPIAASGAGDVIAALFLLHRLRFGSAAAALDLAASCVFGLLARTAEAGSRELLLVAAQDEFVRPTRTFTSRRIA